MNKKQLKQLTTTLATFHETTNENELFEIVTNDTKPNVSINYDLLFDMLTSAKTKYELVNAMNINNLCTTTKPTTTVNENDLYIQVNDFSRIWLRKSRIDFLSLETTCTDLNSSFGLQVIEKSDNGCSKRTHRIECIPKTVDNLKIIIEFLLKRDAILTLAK